MTKDVKIFFCISLLSLIVSCSGVNEINSPPKFIKSVDNYVFLQGRWKRTTDTSIHQLSRINSTYVTCDKKSMTCKENTAVLVIPEDDPTLKIKTLYIVDFTYEIIEWSDDIIKARCLAPVADVEIQISIRDKFAERRFRETKARGSETANPNVYGHWVLE